MKLRLGMVGLGNMGRPMALRMLRAGWQVTVHDVDPSACDLLVREGARVAASPEQVACDAEVVFTCLPSPEVSHSVVFGDAGIAKGRAVRYYVETSTIGSAVMRRIAAELPARITLLDGPVSGGPSAAIEGRLTSMVAGPALAVAAVEPALRSFADRVFHVGVRAGQAQVIKLTNNTLYAGQLALAVEMIHMVRAAGLDEAMAVDVINASSGRSHVTESTVKQQILSRIFSVGARTDILCKDLALAIEEACSLRVDHGTAAAVHSLWESALDNGFGASDVSRIYEFVGSRAAISE